MALALDLAHHIFTMKILWNIEETAAIDRNCGRLKFLSSPEDLMRVKLEEFLREEHFLSQSGSLFVRETGISITGRSVDQPA